MTGRFITFEGLDGSGKTTQLSLLKTFLRDQGLEADTTREPGGTLVAERVRDVLLDPSAEIDDLTEALLFAAARSSHVNERIIPSLESGKWVLCDRFVDSSIAYQSYGRGLPREHVEEPSRLAMRGQTPDLTILLDITADEAVARRRARQTGQDADDRIESSGEEFYHRVRTGYLKQARRDPWRFLVIDATQSVNEIHEQIAEEIDRRNGEGWGRL